MKFLILLLLVTISCVQASSNEEARKKEHEELMKRPWSKENFDYAVKLTKESVAERFKKVLLPEELKNPKLSAKLTEKEKEKLQKRYERSLEYEIRDMHKHLENTMNENKDVIGRLPREAIDKSVKELIEGMEKPIEEQIPLPNNKEL